MTNKMFKVNIGDLQSSLKKVSNCLPQGSHLAPIHFNLYIHTMLEIVDRKFQYAVGTSLAYQQQAIIICRDVLEKDLSSLNNYFYK